MRRPALTAVIMAAALALGACGSSRFGGSQPVASSRVAQAYNAPAPVVEAVPAAPSGSVTSAPLGPPGGPVAADAPVVAALPEPLPTIRAEPAAPSRSNVVGAWSAREASGTSCRMQLSSSPALDLYRASTSGCANRDLARITAWDFRDGEVYLYQPGGAVAARLRASGGSLEGVLAKSGAPLTLSR